MVLICSSNDRKTNSKANSKLEGRGITYRMLDGWGHTKHDGKMIKDEGWRLKMALG